MKNPDPQALLAEVNRVSDELGILALALEGLGARHEFAAELRPYAAALDRLSDCLAAAMADYGYALHLEKTAGGST